MIISKKVQRPPRVSLYLNGNLIHRVQFCYPGLWLSENISWDKMQHTINSQPAEDVSF